MPAHRGVQSSAQLVRDGVQRRREDHNEHCRQDQEAEREEQLDRSLLRSFLGHLPAALPHVDRKVAQDLPDRDTERLALENRLNETW